MEMINLHNIFLFHFRTNASFQMPKEVYEDPEVTGRNRYKYFDRYKVMTDEHVSPDFVRKSLYNQNGSYLVCVCVWYWGLNSESGLIP
jgi:hypothetical protein